MLVVSWFISSFAYFLLYDYIFNFIMFREKYKLSICSASLGISFAILNCILLNGDFYYLRPYFIHVYLVIAFTVVYRKSFVKTLLSILYTMVIVFIAEMIFGIFAVLIFKFSMEEFNNVWYNYLLSNVIVLVEVMCILKMPIVFKLIDSVIAWYNDNEYKSLMIFVLLVLTIATFLLYNNFVSVLSLPALWFTNFFCIGVITFVVGFFKEKTTKNKLIYEYDQLLDYVRTYEEMIEDKSKNQHEHKNQLILIRDMAKNKKIVNYINDLLHLEEGHIETEWVEKLKFIPQGGLKGLIYYKIKEMRKQNVNLYIDVSSELKNKNIWKNLDKNLKDISKAIGVYLDNALEACLNSEQKYITIDVYLENKKIVFEISNTYAGTVDLNKVDHSGYTTKGVGNGYGLSLIKDIIGKNENLDQSRQLNGIYYVQKLYIQK